MKVAAAALGFMAMLLAGACQQGGGLAVAQPASADVQQPKQPIFSACGARFRIPSDWTPIVRGDGYWQLTGDGTATNGSSVSVRCLDETVIPGTSYLDIAEARAELEQMPGFEQAFQFYEEWLDSTPQRPTGLTALHQEQDQGPGRVDVAVWINPARFFSSEPPPAPLQGLIAMHWSADEPRQVEQRVAFLALLDSSFSMTSPATGYDRTAMP